MGKHFYNWTKYPVKTLVKVDSKGIYMGTGWTVDLLWIHCEIQYVEYLIPVEKVNGIQ